VRSAIELKRVRAPVEIAARRGGGGASRRSGERATRGVCPRLERREQQLCKQERE
jgi:hypothetical protein